MALKKTFTAEVEFKGSADGWTINKGVQEVALRDCYIKVGEVRGTKGWARYVVTIEAPNGGMKVFQESFIPDMEGPNFVKQAYLHLKTLPDFVDAIDC